MRKLKLGKNRIVEIPESIFQLPNLEELDLKNCGIPKDVGKQIKKRLKGVKVKT